MTRFALVFLAFALAVACTVKDPEGTTTDSGSDTGTDTGSTTAEDSDTLCQDNIDNDGNGYVDCEDFSCLYCCNVTVSGEDQEKSPEDGNGLKKLKIFAL